MANRWHTARRDTPATQARRRKYNSPEHRAAAAEYKRRRTNGELLQCWRCQLPILGAVHVGHDDHDTNLIRGPEHATCNLKAAARKGRATQLQARKATLRTVRRRNWM